MNYPQLSATSFCTIRNSPSLQSRIDVSATIRNRIVRYLQPIPFIFMAIKQSFPSSDMLHLPTEEELCLELEREQRLIEGAKIEREDW